MQDWISGEKKNLPDTEDPDPFCISTTFRLSFPFFSQGLKKDKTLIFCLFSDLHFFYSKK